MSLSVVRVGWKRGGENCGLLEVQIQQEDGYPRRRPLFQNFMIYNWFCLRIQEIFKFIDQIVQSIKDTKIPSFYLVTKMPYFSLLLIFSTPILSNTLGFVLMASIKNPKFSWNIEGGTVRLPFSWRVISFYWNSWSREGYCGCRAWRRSQNNKLFQDFHPDFEEGVLGLVVLGLWWWAEAGEKIAFSLFWYILIYMQTD